jgi:hypothetical protein
MPRQGEAFRRLRGDFFERIFNCSEELEEKSLYMIQNIIGSDVLLEVGEVLTNNVVRLRKT